MSETESDPLTESLVDLLKAWIETETWNDSHAFLQAHADSLLIDDALTVLDTWLTEGNDRQDAQSDEHEHWLATLQRHRDLLATALDTSVDAAYAEILKPTPLEQAFEALLQANNLAEVLQVVEHYPLLLTEEGNVALTAFMEALQQGQREEILAVFQERYETIQQIRAQAKILPRDLVDLVQSWIDTPDWGASREMLRTHAERLLDDALPVFEVLPSINRENEGAIRALKRHQNLLENARHTSIDETYDNLLLSFSLDEAFQALRQTPPGKIQQTVEQHPLLLADETLRLFLKITDEIEQNGDPATAQALRLRISEVKRIRRQREPAQPPPLGNLPFNVAPEQMEMSADRGGSAVGQNLGTMHSTYIENMSPLIVSQVLKELQDGIGKGNLAGLKILSGEKPDENVETSLALSYEKMHLEQRRYFRALGVFEPETAITPEAAAAVWGSDDLNTVTIILHDLADLALLTEIETPAEPNLPAT